MFFQVLAVLSQLFSGLWPDSHECAKICHRAFRAPSWAAIMEIHWHLSEGDFFEGLFKEKEEFISLARRRTVAKNA